MSTTWFQKEICLTAPSRGFHLLPELTRVKVGMANLFIKHTSASLSINENCDPDVRTDMEGALNRIVPESWNKEFFRHTDEGDDDMPGHIKSTLIGASVNIPITNGKFNLGTWQGKMATYIRKIVVTIQGSTA
uniref:Secondary thiamine-phosphate synthase enzyme n=1 Tax=Phytophthora ramorum TaxID=164328 RepID=H3GAU5_PHYRM